MKQLIFTLLMGVTVLSLGQSYNPDANGNTNIDISDMLSLLSYYGQSGPWAPPSDACEFVRNGNGNRQWNVPDDCDHIYFNMGGGNVQSYNQFWLPDSTWHNRTVRFYTAGTGRYVQILHNGGYSLFQCIDSNTPVNCDWDVTNLAGTRVIQVMYDENEGWQRVPFTRTYVWGTEY